LQRNAFRSFRVGAQLIEHATNDTEMDSADHLRMLVGCLQQGATPQLDHADACIGTRSEPELLQQGDHLATGRHGAGYHRSAGNRALALALGPS